MDFISAAATAASIPEFVDNYDRITGSHLASVLRGSPLDQMIDSSTGHAGEEIAKFCAFFYECVWCRIDSEAT